MSEYKFKVHTGDEYQAGTDSNIFVILQGVLGKSREYRLNGNIKGNAFERNQVDEFTLKTDEEYSDLGPIYAIHLRSDMMYAGAGWLLDYIEIEGQNNAISKFKISQWIEDKKTRTFYDKSQIKKNDVRQKEKNIKSDAMHYVPAGAKMTVEDTLQTKIGFHISQTEIKDTTKSEKISMNGSIKESIGLALEFALQENHKLEENQAITSEVTQTCTQKMELPVCENEAVSYRAVYIVKDEEYTIAIGNLTLTIPNTLSQRAAGFERV